MYTSAEKEIPIVFPHDSSCEYFWIWIEKKIIYNNWAVTEAIGDVSWQAFCLLYEKCSIYDCPHKKETSLKNDIIKLDTLININNEYYEVYFDKTRSTFKKDKCSITFEIWWEFYIIDVKYVIIDWEIAKNNFIIYGCIKQPWAKSLKNTKNNNKEYIENIIFWIISNYDYNLCLLDNEEENS